jgi:hypothetical protein
MLLVALVLLLFLGSPRAAAIVALTIPLALLIAFIFMHHFKIPANLLSLGAIDFGILVDGSVVVLENILRRREREQERPLTLRMPSRPPCRWRAPSSSAWPSSSPPTCPCSPSSASSTSCSRRWRMRSARRWWARWWWRWC